MTKKIKLQNSDKEVLVDDEDYHYIKRFDWYWSPEEGGDGRITRYIKIGKKDYRNLVMEEMIIPRREKTYYHKNGNALDKRKNNIQLLFLSQIRQKDDPRGASQYKGVSRCSKTKKWRAGITKNGQTYYLGSYDIEEEAAEAYNKKARELYGKNAYQNKIYD